MVTVQGGAYGEHVITSVQDGSTRCRERPCFDVRLAPGCGARLELAMRRYAANPTLAFPW